MNLYEQQVTQETVRNWAEGLGNLDRAIAEMGRSMFNVVTDKGDCLTQVARDYDEARKFASVRTGRAIVSCSIV